jgi:uncharacterized GH25 family protein
MRAILQLLSVALGAIGCVGCVVHIRGHVVDAAGHPVPNAHVKINGMFGGMLTGEGPIRDQTVSDAQGRFEFTEPERNGLITAKTSDGKQQGKEPVPSHGDTVVIVR